MEQKRTCNRGTRCSDIRTLGEGTGHRKILIGETCAYGAMKKALKPSCKWRHQGSAPISSIIGRATGYQLTIHKGITGRDAVGAVLHRGVIGAESSSAECNRL